MAFWISYWTFTAFYLVTVFLSVFLGWEDWLLIIRHCLLKFWLVMFSPTNVSLGVCRVAQQQCSCCGRMPTLDFMPNVLMSVTRIVSSGGWVLLICIMIS
jgi:hypothetical protein